MMEDHDSGKSKARSKSYPGISLREAVSRCQTLYEKDGWAAPLAETAAMHWGFAGLNGASRPVLAAVKQFGLVEYIGAGDNLKVQLTSLAKRILRPMNEEEKAIAVAEAILKPRIYSSLHEKFDNWQLPSDATLSARLEREEGIQPKAIKALVASIRDSVAYLREVSARPNIETVALTEEPEVQTQQVANPQKQEVQVSVASDLQKYPMPGSDAFICLPFSMTPEEAKRAKSWVERVIIPAIEFAGGLYEGK